MAAWQEAWDCFLEALDLGGFRNIAPIHPEKDQRFFRQMVRAIRRAGISVQIKNWLDETLDDNGNIVFRTGRTLCERSKNPKPKDIHIIISPPGKSTLVLSHEFAHAADYLLHGYHGARQMEVVASAASYLFICKHLGVFSSHRIIQHARKWGFGSRDVLKQKRQILAVFRKMNSLFRKGSKQKQKAVR